MKTKGPNKENEVSRRSVSLPASSPGPTFMDGTRQTQIAMRIEPQRKLTIAHFLPSAVMGGVETATLRMTAATIDRFRHVAFCLEEATVLRELFEQQGIETVTYVPPVPSLRHGLRFYKESKRITRKLKGIGADIVHFGDKFAAYYISLAAYLAGSKIICHIRLSHPRLTLRDRLSLWPVHSFIFVSNDSRQTFYRHLPERRARVIYDSIDTTEVNTESVGISVREELRIASDITLVGMVARVAPQKDFFTLATAAAAVIAKHPATRFVVVGENSIVESHQRHFEAVIRRLDELKITDKFIFTGHRSDVARLTAAMDICVLCTHREGFGLVVAEAMAKRKPVVATAVGGLLEIVIDGQTGYLHEHENSRELAEKILFLIDNPQKAKEIGSAGYDYVKQKFSTVKFVEDISKAYHDVIVG